MSPPVLAATGVEVSFGGVLALAGVSISVPEGGVVGLLGPNGAGKTTLFGVLSGLIRPRAGQVTMAGKDVTNFSPQRRAALGLARTFQRLELFRELTVGEHLQVAYRARHQRWSVARDLVGLGRRAVPGEANAVTEILESLGLVAAADTPAADLPLGTARLVEVARAVANGPRVLLLDEPSSGLDSGESDQLADSLRRLREDRGVALLVIEHHVDFVLGLADHVTVLDFGSVIAEGTPAEIRADRAVQSAYLGTVQ